MTDRLRAFLVIFGVYAVVLVGVAGVLEALPPVIKDAGPRALLAAAFVTSTLITFVGSVATRCSSVFDPWWSVAPPAGALWLFLGDGALTAREAGVLVVVGIWAVRLTYNWATGFHGLQHDDWRYVAIREKTGKLYWAASLGGIHLFPTFFVTLVCLPFVDIASSQAPLALLDVIGLLVVVGATVIEGLADEQMRAFKRAAAAGAVCDVGLWSWSRHPNYFGEIMVWVGVWLVGVAAGAPAWLVVAPIALTLLFVAASIPLMERRQAKKPAWAAYKARTSMLLPLPPRKPPG